MPDDPHPASGYPWPVWYLSAKKLSSINDWQETAALLCLASFATTTELRKVLIPPSLEMDLVLIKEEVFFP